MVSKKTTVQVNATDPDGKLPDTEIEEKKEKKWVGDPEWNVISPAGVSHEKGVQN